MCEWAEKEAGGTSLGDARLTRRFVRLTKSLAEQPELSVPQACGDWWDTKAAYRFWSHPRLQPEMLLSGHVQQTVRRALLEPVVLAVQDGTQLRYTGHRCTRGLGRLRRPGQRGIFLHTLLAVSPSGLPLGVLDLQFWTWPAEKASATQWQRSQQPAADKESRHWLAGMNAAQVQLAEHQRVVVIGDRESDFFDLYAAPRREGVELLVRARERRRRVRHPAQYAQAAVAQSPCLGHVQVEVSRQDGAPQRTATVAVHALSLETEAPQNWPRRKELPTLPLTWVWAHEQSPPQGSKPVEWLLVTTLEATKLADAAQALAWYALRWRIERWFYVLKQGCRIEKLELETVERLQLAVATYAIAAWRILWLTYAARQTPDASCDVALSSHEWQALTCYASKTARPPTRPPTVAEAVRMLGRLGGRVQPNSPKLPGVKALWVGLQRLHDLTLMYRLLTHPPPALVGNA